MPPLGEDLTPLFFDVEIGARERLRVWAKIAVMLACFALLYLCFKSILGLSNIELRHRFYAYCEGAALIMTGVYFLFFYSSVFDFKAWFYTKLSQWTTRVNDSTALRSINKAWLWWTTRVKGSTVLLSIKRPLLGTSNAAADRTRKAFTLSISRRCEGVVLGFFGLAVIFFYVSFSNGVDGNVKVQLASACCAAACILFADLVIMRRTTNAITKLYYNMIVHHVDVPMLIAFLCVSGAMYFVFMPYYLDGPNELEYVSAFFAGAVGFQLVGFNIIFLFIWDSVVRMSVGRYAPLVLPDGGLLASQQEFRPCWNAWCQRARTDEG